MNAFRRLLYRPFFIKLFHWEYWSFNTVYIPIYAIWIGLCIRARSFFFFAAANPSIKNGGFLSESKKQIVPLIPPGVHPRTVFFSNPADLRMVLHNLEDHAMTYPLVGKPDVGSKGRGVQVLHNQHELETYVQDAGFDFHIQEFVPYQHEAGFFYYRYPGQPEGRLSCIVGKKFLTVKGDGHSTVRQLIQKNKRAVLQTKALDKTWGSSLDKILPEGVEKLLVPYGNHARGALFTDESWRIDEMLEHAIDAICIKIPGFFFGRLDIRYESWESLKAGKNFAVIEVNGAGSEPTHIYDPRHSLFFAWKEIVRHWLILGKISRANHKTGIPYLTVRQGIEMFREDREESRKLAKVVP